MQLHELTHPDLDVSVRYRVLAPPEVDMLILERDSMNRDSYMRLVIEAVIYNLPEITESLRVLPKEQAKNILSALCNGALMLNPGLDPDTWITLAEKRQQPAVETPATKTTKRKSSTTTTPAKKISREKYVNLDRYLQERVIGQDSAIGIVSNTLKRSLAGLGDENRPLGVFLFAGASGVGKTLLARELHNYLFKDTNLVRVDCGEYQHKHESSKLLGAPPGYVGYDDGSAFVNAVKKNPHTVVLLDEVEKAHPDIWNTFLRVFDEGILTDSSGAKVDFRDTIIIMTTNLGNRQVADETMNRRMGFDAPIKEVLLPSYNRVERLANEAIRKMFSPEFLNRIDNIVVFNHLTQDNLSAIAELELNQVDSKLSKKGLSFEYSEDVIVAMVNSCNSVQGARKLSGIRRDLIETPLAEMILTRRYPRGTLFSISHVPDTGYQINAHRPKKSTEKLPSMVTR